MARFPKPPPYLGTMKNSTVIISGASAVMILAGYVTSTESYKPLYMVLGGAWLIASTAYLIAQWRVKRHG